MTETQYAGKETLKVLAQKSWRGVSIPDLVCSIQYQRDRLEDFKAVPDAFISFVPTGCTREEYVEDTTYFYECLIESIEKELERRQIMQFQGVTNINKEIIQTIKEKLSGQGLADVIGWYTDVFVHQNRWTFRCTLHGEDKHPSGVIYLDEMRWWCFGCNKGGDAFDAVQEFERVELPQAITKLARHLGIDNKPLFPKSKKRGGMKLTLKE